MSDFRSNIMHLYKHINFLLISLCSKYCVKMSKKDKFYVNNSVDNKLVVLCIKVRMDLISFYHFCFLFVEKNRYLEQNTFYYKLSHL